MQSAECRVQNESRSVQSAECGANPRPSFCTPHSAFRTAFTLTELLIVIGLIVLILIMAVPALDFITGSNSIDGAQNQISAMLGRARTEAIGLQEPVGVAFFRDPANDRLTMALVDYVPNSTDLQFIDDRDQQLLQPGVGMQLVNDAATPYVQAGVIMFDGFGRLIHQAYAPTAALNDQAEPDFLPNGFTQFGFVLYNREAYSNQPAVDQVTWLDNNALPLLVNRYNGTLVKGE